MVQIIEENRRPSVSERFGQAFADISRVVPQFLQQRQQREAMGNLLGQDLAKLPPEFQKLAFQNQLQQELQAQKFKQEKELQGLRGPSAADLKSQKEINEQVNSLKSAQDSLNRMKSLRKKGNLGRGSGILGIFGGERAKDRGEYEQLGKSLIQYATNIPIRNRLEFETLAERLYDASITDSEAEGILNAMERIINNSMKQYAGEDLSIGSTVKPAQQKKPLTAFIGSK